MSTDRLTAERDRRVEGGSPSESTLTRAMGRLASWRIVVGSGALLALSAGLFFASSAPFSIPRVEAVCGAAPPDVRPYTGAAEVHAFLDACGPAGRAAYRNLQLADLVYPLVVGVFMASALALALRRLFPGRPAAVGLAAVALLGSGFDYLENAAAWGALAAFPDHSPSAHLLGPASAAKTATSWVAGCMLVLAVVALAVRGARARLPRTGPGPSATRTHRDRSPGIVG